MVRWFVDRSPERGIPSVSLRRLLPEAQFVGCRDWEVSGCTADSRRLEPGQVFVAVPGPRQDGHDFIGRALERGAAGVVVERHCPEAGKLQVVVPDTRLALARLCHALAGDPSRHLRVCAVTGHSGRNVAALLLRSIFEATGARVGLVGQQAWSDGLESHPTGRLPIDAEHLALMLAAMVERGCAAGVIEVTDEAIEKRCVTGIRFEAAVVTDLRADGLEGDPAERRRAVRSRAARLFRMVAPGGATIVNADDPHAELLGAVNLGTRRVSYALERRADVSAQIDELSAAGSRFRLHGFDREAEVELRLVGSQNVRSALAAAAVAWSRGLDVGTVVEGLEAVGRVPGQFEVIAEGQPFEVRIDRARSPIELRQALKALREICTGHLFCVLGSEGHQPRTMRFELAAAAEAGADRVILTTDSPRTENPDWILDDLLAGFRGPGRVWIEPDRRGAIETALATARAGDGVLVAGRGHEAFQIFADRAVPFDDRAVVIAWLRQHRVSVRRTSA